MKNIIFLLLLLSIRSYGQDRTNYYRYNSSNGTSERIGYSEPERTSRYNDYVGAPVNDYVNVMMIKQNQYNNGSKAIQDQINRVTNILMKLSRINPDASNQINDRVNQVIEQMNKGKYDYSNPNVTNSFLNYLQQLENQAIDYLTN